VGTRRPSTSPQPRPLPDNYALLREIVQRAGRGSHQTAQEIFLAARAQQPRIGFATVHRGLARLCERGDILKIDLANADAAWYEPVAPPHAHLRCERCGALVDVDYATARRTLNRIAQQAGVEIVAESLTFRGRCAACANAPAARRRPWRVNGGPAEG
jgi:Fe2+ or Zn2+ uptake regulation protein